MRTELYIKIANQEELIYGLNFEEARKKSHQKLLDEISVFVTNSVSGFDVFSIGFDGKDWHVKGKFNHLEGFEFVEDLDRILL